MVNISFYGSHNAAYVVEKDGEILTVLEVERFLNYKNSGVAQYRCPKVEDIYFIAKYIPRFLMKKYNIEEFDNCFYLNSDVIYLGKSFLEKYIKARNYSYGYHHLSHAAGAFYQSEFPESLIFSFDGGGNDGFFNVYKCKRGESPTLLEQVLNPVKNTPHIYYDLGFPYMMLAHYLSEIKYEHLPTGNLVYPGKLMGLTSYGNVIEEWIEPMMEFYKSGPDGENYHEKVRTLSEKIGVHLDVSQRVSGQTSYDIAKTSQKVFEECFLEVAKPYFEKYPDLPVCIAGGCGLNILLNTRLVNEFNKDVFVPPDPNDCGIALGLMLEYLKPLKSYDSTYSGLELLDVDMLGTYIHESQHTSIFRSYFYKTERMIKDLNSGKIVGVCRGRSEHGPRALGNRSILCNPMVPQMKDILNEKVKHREWFRPFAPVVRLEDVNKYFEWDRESRWMGFCPVVREEWREKLSAVTHVDNTARVQTVTEEQNPWLYNLLTEFEKSSGVGVLLNTSFNVAGKPISSSVKDAMEIFEKTDMECLMIEDVYMKKIEAIDPPELDYVEDCNYDPEAPIVMLESDVLEPEEITPEPPVETPVIEVPVLEVVSEVAPIDKKTKMVTAFYAYHDNGPYWGQTSRNIRYKYSLVSICNMGVDVVCYTDVGELGYDELVKLKEDFNLTNLEIKIYELKDNPYIERVNKIRGENPSEYVIPGRSPQIYALKFKFLGIEYEPDINLYWVDCGLSFPGLFPEFASKYFFEDGRDRFINNYPLEKVNPTEEELLQEEKLHGFKRYSYDKAFNENTIRRINQFQDNKILLLTRSATDDKTHLLISKINKDLKYQIDCPEFPVGGLFGGNSNLIPEFIKQVEEVIDLSLEMGHCGSDQEYLWYVLWNHREWFNVWGFTGFYHFGEEWKDIVDENYVSFSEFFLDPEHNLKNFIK